MRKLMRCPWECLVRMMAPRIRRKGGMSSWHTLSISDLVVRIKRERQVGGKSKGGLEPSSCPTFAVMRYIPPDD